MSRFKLFLFFLVFFTTPIIAQKQANNWVFGYGASLTWNKVQNYDAKRLDNGETIALKRIPTPIKNDPISQGASQFISNGTSFALSDKDGNLRLYSDSRSLWNKFYEKRTDLQGSYLGTPQGGTLIPLGVSLTDYIAVVPINSSTGVYVYKISELNGTINVTGSPINLATSVPLGRSIAQTAAVVLKANKKDMWVIAPNLNNSSPAIFAITLNSSGNLTGQNIQSPLLNVPITFNINSMAASGQMKLSPDSRHILWAMGDGDGNGKNSSIMLAKFDINTGEVSNIKYKYSTARAIEFSPNGKYVYIVEGNRTFIYDSNTLLYADDPNTVSPVYSYTIPTINATCFLQMAPDGRIYQAVASTISNKSRNLIVINKPNHADSDPEVCILEDILAPGTYTSGGLCNFSGSWFSSDIDGDEEACANAENLYSYTYLLGATSEKIAYTIWEFSDGSPNQRIDVESSGQAAEGTVSCPHTFSKSGVYTIRVSSYTSSNVLISKTMDFTVLVNSCVVKVNPHIRGRAS